MNKRDEFAAAALSGIIAMPDNHDLSGVEDAAFKVADRMIALSAPDAIEALEEVVKVVQVLEDQCVLQGRVPVSIVTELGAVTASRVRAQDVLARYKKEPE